MADLSDGRVIIKFKGQEDCVRMRGGKLNDAVCAQTWTGNRRDAIGMGFVCEKHDPVCVPATNPEALEDGEYVIKA